MRRRLLMSTLAVVVTAVLLLGLPLAFVLSRLQISAATEQVQRDATTAARSLQARVNVGLRPDAFLARSADVLGSVRITQPDAFLDLLAEAGAAPHFLGTLAEKVVLARRAPPAPTLK